MGSYAQAIACFDKAININQELADGWNNKGSALYKFGRYSEAKEVFRQAKEFGILSASQMLGRLEREGH